jgi:cell division septation protein DedD
MSAKLFNEPHQRERPQHKNTIKKIDDLILDAEIEAQIEIDQKIRSRNTRMLLLVLVGVGLFYVVNSETQDQTISVPSFSMEEAQVAEAPSAPGPTPKPIPFPVTESAPVKETSVSVLSEPQGEDLSPLENEAITMIQKNLGKSEEAASDLGPEPVRPSQNDALVVESTSSLTPEIQTSPAPAKLANPAFNPDSKSRGEITTGSSSPKSILPQLTEAQSEFFIQVGAFSVKANADRVIKKLMSGGFSPLVQTRTTRSSMHVVFIGGFADKKSPQNMITELRNKGLNPLLKKNDNGSYSIVLGKEKSKERAETLKQKLTKQGIFTSMKQMKIDRRMFIVRVGGFESNTNALQGQKKLVTMGYKGTLIRKKS